MTAMQPQRPEPCKNSRSTASREYKATLINSAVISKFKVPGVDASPHKQEPVA